MTTFSERLAAAKQAPKPFREVTVTLDADIAEQREQLRSQIEFERKNNDARLAVKSKADELQEQLDELNELVSESLVTLRFTRLSGVEWAELTARCPVRLDAAIDRQYGYNMHAVCRLAAPLSGGILVEGEVNSLSDSEWVDLFETVSGFEFNRIVDAIYELNEYEPAMRVSALKKELSSHLDSGMSSL